MDRHDKTLWARVVTPIPRCLFSISAGGADATRFSGFAGGHVAAASSPVLHDIGVAEAVHRSWRHLSDRRRPRAGSKDDVLAVRKSASVSRPAPRPALCLAQAERTRPGLQRVHDGHGRRCARGRSCVVFVRPRAPVPLFPRRCRRACLRRCRCPCDMASRRRRVTGGALALAFPWHTEGGGAVPCARASLRPGPPRHGPGGDGRGAQRRRRHRRLPWCRRRSPRHHRGPRRRTRRDLRAGREHPRARCPCAPRGVPRATDDRRSCAVGSVAPRRATGRRLRRPASVLRADSSRRPPPLRLIRMLIASIGSGLRREGGPGDRPK